MGRSRIWKNKPPEVRERLRAERAEAGRQGSEVGGRRSDDGGPLPVPEVVVVDVAVMFGRLSETERAVAWSLMGNHGMSMWGAVNVVREVKI